MNAHTRRSYEFDVLMYAMGALLVSASGLSGQAAVGGTVIDAQSGAPIVGARVLLFRANEELVRSTDTDSRGAFLVGVPQSGSYFARVERIGYPAHTTELLEVSDRQRLTIEIRLSPQAIGLDSLVVVGRRRETGREAFERRRATAERGTFMDPVQVALTEAPLPTDILKRVPGIEVTHLDNIRLPGRGCLLVYLDNMRFPIMGGVNSRMVLRGEAHLNEFISARSVRGVEIYPRIADVPREIRRSRRWPEIETGKCGVIIIWTTTAW